MDSLKRGLILLALTNLPLDDAFDFCWLSQRFRFVVADADVGSFFGVGVIHNSHDFPCVLLKRVLYKSVKGAKMGRNLLFQIIYLRIAVRKGTIERP